MSIKLKDEAIKNQTPIVGIDEVNHENWLPDQSIVFYALKDMVEECSKWRHISLNKVSMLIGKDRRYLSSLASLPDIETLFRISVILGFAPKDISDMNPFLFLTDKKSIEFDYSSGNYFYSDKAQYQQAIVKTEEMYDKFRDSKWYAENKYDSKYKYFLELDKEFDVFRPIDNSMQGSLISRGADVIYYNEGTFDENGAIYCCSIKNDSKKILRHIYGNGDSFILCTHNSHKITEPSIFRKDEIKIHGKVVYIINKVTK